MSDRKEYHRSYYQNKIKVKRAMEKEASMKLPELLQDLSINKLKIQLLQAENSDLRTRLQEQEERLAILTIEKDALNEECMQKSNLIATMSRYPIKKTQY